MGKNDQAKASVHRIASRGREELPSIGLALAGGAPQGAIYEIGALKALEEAVDGLDLTRLRAYVGVSAGAFLASCLANGLTPDQMCRAIVKPEPGEHPFVPETFFRPAVREIAGRLARTPAVVLGALRDFVTRRERRLLDALTQLGKSLPVAAFDNEPMRDYVESIFAKKGRTDDFRELRSQLVVVATDLESSESVRFGESGNDHVPISKAVQASSALPGLYPPVEIDGRFYVDGILRKTMHASVVLDAGAELIFAINPIVPVDTRPAVEKGLIERGKVIDQGLTTVLAQSVRTMIYSRMRLGLDAYKTRFPDTDVVHLEPRRDDHESFFSNIFSFASRRKVCERAYRATRRSLLERREEIEPALERHGLGLNLEVLQEEDRDLWASVGLGAADGRPAQASGKLANLDRALSRLEAAIQEHMLDEGAADAPAETTAPSTLKFKPPSASARGRKTRPARAAGDGT